jgi:two-component system nitrogen regulation response regulator GlnG
MTQPVTPDSSSTAARNSGAARVSHAVTMTVWIVDEDESLRWALEKSLTRNRFRVRCFGSAVEFQDALNDDAPDVLICDIQTPNVDVLSLMERLRSQHPQLPVIMTTAHSDLDAAIAAYKNGAYEYLPKPFEIDDMGDLVMRATKRRGEATQPARAIETALIGKSPTMQDVYRAISRLSQSQATVLITGEAGTGKQLVARALHGNSARAQKPFVVVNAAAIPKNMMESEFFGYERGVFSSAAKQRKGRFEQADGGTVFLDEIGDMSVDVQMRLLCLLQNGEFYRVGGITPIKIDVRVVAATYQDLETLVEQGRFLKDLYHRLNVIRLRIAPLRERREDVALLTRYFLAKIAQEHKTEPKRLLPQVLARLKAYDWPGNVRQLENICRWLTIMVPGLDIHFRNLPPELRRGAEPLVPAAMFNFPSKKEADHSSADAWPPADSSTRLDWNSVLRQWAQAQLWDGHSGVFTEASPIFERTLIEVALHQCRGQRMEAARRLGWDRNTLTRKIKTLGIEG